MAGKHKHSVKKAGTGSRLIAFAYFNYNREWIACAPLYSGESSAGPEVMQRALSRFTPEQQKLLQAKLQLSKRVLLPVRHIPHRIIYNIESPAISGNSGQKQNDLEDRHAV